MGLITLTSDMGLKDFYVAAVKGAIYSQHPEAKVVDISHQVEPFNIIQAAFILKNCYHEFPAGTIHILCVNDLAKDNQKYLAIRHNGHYFICCDNGIIDLILKDEPEKIVEIALNSDSEDSVFFAKDRLAKAAAFLSRGGTMEFLGKETNTYTTRNTFSSVTSNNEISGAVCYIDSYGNAVSNIDKTQFKLIGKGRPFRIQFSAGEFYIDQISKEYGNVPSGEKLALFGVSGNLEIAVNRGTVRTGGGANQLFGLQEGSPIRIEFEDVTNR